MHNGFRGKAVETAIHSTPGLRGRDERLHEWKSKAYALSNADARTLSTKLLDGKQVTGGGGATPICVLFVLSGWCDRRYRSCFTACRVPPVRFC